MSASTKRRSTGGQKPGKELAASNKTSPKKDSSEQVQPSSTLYDDEPWTPGAYTVFKIIMSARLCAAAWNIVGDCDETYNYWEPTHYLMFGKGFQTWEYSPVYAIRSYAYIMLHTLPMRIYCAIFTPNPVMLFFFTRCFLAFVCALCEVYFYKGVCKQFGNNTARILLCFQIMGTGLFISSTAYLPSSFCMYMTFLSVGGWMQARYDERVKDPSSFCMYMTFLSVGGWMQARYDVAIMGTAASAILGWPFAGALGIPIAYDIVIRRRRLKVFIIWCVIALLVFLLPVVLIDQYYYGKLIVTPLNIVLYNVFTDHGPDLYGVEPFSFYFINGLLNFNVAFVLALVSLPFVLVSLWILKEKEQGIPSYIALAPMYIWMAIFFTRPHKEERFLFPIYPFIVLCGAITVDYIQKLSDHWFPTKGSNNYAENTSLFSVFIGIFFSLMSISRAVAIYQGYHAPLDLFVELNKISTDTKVHTLGPDKTVNVCVGKEWYRFPSSFFLPNNNWNLQFLQSEFKGQLPKPFSTEPHGTRLIPSNMNDINKEEPSRYVNLQKCHYLIDLDLPRETTLEPRYSNKTEEWKILASIPFLDASRSHRVFRAFYIPFVSNRFCKYENYNLLKTTRTKKNSKPKPSS